MRETVHSLNERAIELSDTGDYTGAIACFRRAITVERNNHLLFFNLGITYFHAGDLARAKNALLQARRLKGDESETLGMLAIVCKELGEKEDALLYCAEALGADSRNPTVWNTIGAIHFSAEAYGDACEAFEQAVTLNPYYYDALFNLRDTYDELGNRPGVEACEKQLAALRGAADV